VGPLLPLGGVLLVHDFPPEFTTEADWEQGLAPFGLTRHYRDVQEVFTSCLAVFARV
jgi:hypothetical protein